MNFCSAIACEFVHHTIVSPSVWIGEPPEQKAQCITADHRHFLSTAYFVGDQQQTNKFTQIPFLEAELLSKQRRLHLVHIEESIARAVSQQLAFTIAPYAVFYVVKAAVTFQKPPLAGCEHQIVYFLP